MAVSPIQTEDKASSAALPVSFLSHSLGSRPMSTLSANKSA